MEYQFLEKLKEAREWFEEETVDLAIRLTELEDFKKVKLNVDYVDDDINEEIELVKIPKPEKINSSSSKTWWEQSRNKLGETILQQKVIGLKFTNEPSDQLEEIRKLIVERFHPVNVCDHAGLTPLHETANLGLPRTALLLLKHGADIDAKTNNLKFDVGDLQDDTEEGAITPLQDACSTLNGEIYEILMKKLNVIDILLYQNPNVLVRNAKNKTPLQCFTEQMNVVLSDNKEYNLTEKDVNAFKQIQKRLSIKTANQTNDPKLRNKSHESTVTHIRGGLNQEAEEIRRPLRSPAVHRPVLTSVYSNQNKSRADRLLDLEQRELLPLTRNSEGLWKSKKTKHEPLKEMSHLPNQPSIFDQLNRKPVRRRGLSKRSFIANDSSEDENIQAPRKSAKMSEDEEEIILDHSKNNQKLSPVSFILKSPLKTPLENLRASGDHSPSKNSSASGTESSNPARTKFRVLFKNGNEESSFRIAADLNSPLQTLIDKAMKSEPVLRVIREKKKIDVCLEPDMTVSVKALDGSIDELPATEKICDVIDFENKENERLIVQVTRWKHVTASLEEIFRRSLTEGTDSDSIPETFQTAISNVNRSGILNIKGNVDPLYLQASIKIFSHHSIKEINLSGINLSGMTANIAKALAETTNISNLVLENCHLTKEMLRAIKIKSRSITQLDISSNQLGDCGEELAIFLQGMSSLQDLKIARNRITKDTMDCYDLNFSNLRSLNLSHNLGIGSQGINSLKILLSDQPMLESLYLNQITKKGDLLGEILSSLFSESVSQIRTLTLTKNNLSDDEIKDLAAALAQFSEIEYLDISYNRNITKTAIEEIFDQIKDLKELRITGTAIRSLEDLNSKLHETLKL